MKLLFLMENLYPIIGGAEHSIDTLIHELDQRPGVDVEFLCQTEIGSQPDVGSRIEANDVVVTQLNWADLAIRTAGMCGKKSILFIRSYENVCSKASDGVFISHCGQRCRSCVFKQALPIHPDLIIANSHFTAQFLLSEHGLQSEVVYPFINSENVIAAAGKRRFITMNQFAYHKGVDIFARVAQALPEASFRVVGYQSSEIDDPLPPNMILSGPLDPRAFYADTLIFLAPFRVQEPFGRTFVEARLNRIPVIASAGGAAKVDGLVAKELLVEDIDNTEAWLEKIQLVLSDYDFYSYPPIDGDIEQCRPEVGADKFLSLVQQLVDSD